MANTGIIRRLDHLGRLVIPKEIRDSLGIHQRDPIAFFVDGDRVIIKKHPVRHALREQLQSLENTAYAFGDTLPPETMNRLTRHINEMGKLMEALEDE